MTCYERMAVLLKSTGVYSMDGTTLIDAEMMAYGAVIQTMFDAVAALQDGIFYDTLESDYSADYERLFGLPVTSVWIEGTDLEERQEKIDAMKLRLLIDNDSFDRQGLTDALLSFGVTATFTETSTGVTVNVTDSKGYLATDDEIIQTIGDLFCCGVTVTVTGLS